MKRTRIGGKWVLAVVLSIVFASWGWGQKSAPRIFLVRHCEKALESTDDPNLSDEGKRRAERLAFLLQSAGIEEIFSTATRRTMQTGEPVARAAGVSIKNYDLKNNSLATDLKNISRTTLVVCHSYNLAELLKALTGRTDITPSDDYGELFMVTFTPNGAEVAKFHF